MTRRSFITLSSISAAWILTGCGGGEDGGGGSSFTPGAGSGGSPGNPTPAPGELAIPPLLDPPANGGVKQFNLSIQAGSKEFFPGIRTGTYGISGDYFGKSTCGYCYGNRN